MDEAAGVIHIIQKGERAHEVRITPVIRRLLAEARGKHEELVWTYKVDQRSPMCPGEPGTLYPVTYGGFSSAFRWISEKAGENNCRIHDLRKTAGSRLYRVTGDIVGRPNFPRHSNITITRKHYMHVVPLDVARRVEACEAFYEGKRGKEPKLALPPDLVMGKIVKADLWTTFTEESSYS